jgi:hypothetical protein
MLEKIDRYLNEYKESDVYTKKAIKASKSFIDDLRITKGKYDFAEIPGVVASFIDSHIKELSNIKKELSKRGL